MIFGGICQRTVSRDGQDAPEDAENPNSTAMSASCSAPMTSRIVASLGIGKEI